jgi:hypothetical protein
MQYMFSQQLTFCLVGWDVISLAWWVMRDIARIKQEDEIIYGPYI